jgi:Leucine-rich repeat (LRR) protein
MEKNSFTEEIPSQVTFLSNLYELHLNKNSFIGFVPRSFGNLSSLRFLSLANNILEGSIPVELEHLSKLEYLDLSNNNLSGMVPKQLSLHTIGLVYNQFSGYLLFDFGLTLPILKMIYLEKNQSFGLIPTIIINASKLEIIDLPFNALTGPIPKNLGFLKNLRHINFTDNPLGDENDTDITLLTSLTQLHQSLLDSIVG